MSVETEIDPCEVCNEPEASTLFSGFDGVHQKCPRCGEFKLTGTASSIMRQGLGKEKRALLSGWVKNQNRMGSIPMITSENLKEVLESPPPSIAERANFLLLEAESKLKGLGEMFNITEPRFLSATYSSTKQDVNFLLKMLSAQGYVEAKTLAGGCEILPAGYMYLEKIKTMTSASTNGFVAMSFQEVLSEIYSSGFQVGVIGAGYDPIRMDKLEHINRIDDEIIKQINGSKFLVADFTGHRSGVYFEAGYAMGRGLPIFWTCRKNDMNELHFDIRQFNCIDWESSEDLSTRLKTRIEAVLGKGPR
jgi:nucleoside 2-deoxyribosyltransferase